MVEEGFRDYTDANHVFSIAAPVALLPYIQEYQLGLNPEATRFGVLLLDGDGIRVKLTCTKLEAWHKHVTYIQSRTREEYSEEALYMMEARLKERDPERAGSVIQWEPKIYQKEVEGGFISIRSATWWGDNVVPHTYTYFVAVSDAWIVAGSVEEEVPASTWGIVRSFAFLPQAAKDEAAANLEAFHRSHWD